MPVQQTSDGGMHPGWIISVDVTLHRLRRLRPWFCGEANVVEGTRARDPDQDASDGMRLALGQLRALAALGWASGDEGACRTLVRLSRAWAPSAHYEILGGQSVSEARRPLPLGHGRARRGSGATAHGRPSVPPCLHPSSPSASSWPPSSPLGRPFRLAPSAEVPAGHAGARRSP
jgi:hypothetical protein